MLIRNRLNVSCAVVISVIQKESLESVVEVPIVTLEELPQNLPRVDYIKLDIEGAELEMLHGAAKTIAHFKPKMAISAYHKPEDLWTLATYIKSLRPDYKFEFRHYRIDCKDYILNDNERSVLKYFGLSYPNPTACEMVLYCN